MLPFPGQTAFLQIVNMEQYSSQTGLVAYRFLLLLLPLLLDVFPQLVQFILADQKRLDGQKKPPIKYEQRCNDCGLEDDCTMMHKGYSNSLNLLSAKVLVIHRKLSAHTLLACQETLIFVRHLLTAFAEIPIPPGSLNWFEVKSG